jgi:transposase
MKGKQKMARKKGIANRRYTPEFKAEAMALAKSIGGNEAAMRLGMPESSLWNSLKAEAVDNSAGSVLTVRGQGSSAKRAGISSASGESASHATRNRALAQENAELKRKLADSQADLAILKKAAAHLPTKFARESK